MSLPEAWFVILALVLFLYLATDGFDLGVGVITLLVPDEDTRGIMACSIESVWHANQTWLVIAGGVLFGAFPTVYGSMLPALYLPAALMLMALICRGIALEYRPHAENKPLFSLAFGLGSLAGAASHGLLIGGVLSGVPLEDGYFDGTIFDCFSILSLLLAGTFVCVDMMLGGCWLMMKMQGARRDLACDWAVRGSVLTLIAGGAVVVWVALNPEGAELARELFQPGPLTLLLLSGALALANLAALIRNAALPAFFLGAASLLAAMSSFASAIFPVIVPPRLTVDQAASPDNMLAIMLWVVGLLLPVLILYNGYQYRVFRGKAAPEADEA